MKLTEREIELRKRKIYKLHLAGVTFEDLGAMYGISRERVRAIFDKVNSLLTKANSDGSIEE